MSQASSVTPGGPPGKLEQQLNEHIASFMDYLRAKSYSGRTERLYREDLRMFVRWVSDRDGLLSLTDIGRAEMTEYQTHLLLAPSQRSGRPREAGTRGHHTAALKAFFRFLVRSGHLFSSPAEVLVTGRARHKLPSILTPREALCLLAAACSEDMVSLRDRAALEVLYGSGLRSAELLACDLGDLELNEGYLHVHHGKGRKSRVVPLTGEAVAALRVYLAESRAKLATGKRGGKKRDTRAHSRALWLSSEGCRWCPSALFTAVRKYARLAGISKKVNPHLLRHSCATHLLQGGADIRHVQELLGHEKLSTTQRYTHLSTADLRDMISRHHPRSDFAP